MEYWLTFGRNRLLYMLGRYTDLFVGNDGRASEILDYTFDRAMTAAQQSPVLEALSPLKENPGAQHPPRPEALS